MRGGRLTVRNRSTYPDQEVDRVVRFATAELDIRGEGLLVVVDDVRGRSRYGKSTVYDARDLDQLPPSLAEIRRPGARYILWVRLGPRWTFPTEPFQGRKGSERYRVWQEALLSFTAWSAKCAQDWHDEVANNRPRCDAFADWMLQRYREANPSPPVAGKRGRRNVGLVG